MKLSIIIVNYNTEKITLNCLKSIDKYPFEGEFEVVLVDNASSDDSVKEIKKYKPKSYKLTLIQNDENLGFSKANNQGIRKSKGEYKLLLNSDTLATRNAFDELYKFAVNHQDAGIIAPKLLNKDKSTQDSVFRFPTLMRTIRQYWFGEKGLTDKYAPAGNAPVEVEAVVGAAFMITPRAIKLAGILDERYFMFFEDIDYCRKVKNAGLKVYYVPDIKVIHLHGSSGKKVAKAPDQWKRLIPGSKIYHGKAVHYLRWFVMRSSQIVNG